MSFIPTNQELGIPENATPAERAEALKLAYEENNRQCGVRTSDMLPSQKKPAGADK